MSSMQQRIDRIHWRTNGLLGSLLEHSEGRLEGVRSPGLPGILQSYNYTNIQSIYRIRTLYMIGVRK